MYKSAAQILTILQNALWKHKKKEFVDRKKLSGISNDSLLEIKMNILLPDPHDQLFLNEFCLREKSLFKQLALEGRFELVRRNQFTKIFFNHA